MKRKGRHPERALTAVKVRQVTKPGRHADGNGLYLVVDESGARRWLLRTIVHGRRRDVGLGSARLVPLAEAREIAARYRRLAREGGDPLVEKRRAQAVVPTFADAARRVHGEHARGWKNKKHASQWINTLVEYAFPAIGDKRVDQVDTPDVLRVLEPIWLAKPETARRVRQRVGSVLDWAKAAGLRNGDNPVEGVSRGLPRQPDRRRHFATMPYDDVPDFIRKLRKTGISETARLALEFLILTAARTGEVLGARWDEVDLKAKVWTIPASRMKMGREHRVPLGPRAVEILRRAKRIAGGSELVFPGRSGDTGLSNMVFLMALRRMGVAVTVHGFRSAFRDWAAERTSFAREVCEAALAHTIKSKAEAAYRRGDLLDKRRELMVAWEKFCSYFRI